MRSNVADEDISVHPSQSIIAGDSLVHPHGPGLWRTGISSSIYLFLVYVGLGFAGTPFSQMALERACADINIPWDACNDKTPGYDDAQKSASQWMSTWSIAQGALQIATCAGYGVLGDALGRRWPLIMPGIGGFICTLALAWLPASCANNALLAVGFITSATGGQYVTNMAAMASLADVTQHASAKERASVFALVEAATWGGLLIGPVLGGWCADQFGNQQAFWVILGFNAINLVITVFTYRETLDKDARRPFSWMRANPIAAVLMFLQNRIVLLLAVVLVMGMLATTGGGSVQNLYTLKVTDMTGTMLGLLGSVRLGAGCVGLVFAMPLLSRCFTLPRLMTLSMLNGVVGWLVLSVVDQNWEFFAASAILVLSAVYFPIVRTGMTNTFGRERYGEALAAVGTLEQIMQMLAPVMFNTIYGDTEHTTIHVGFLEIRCITFLVAAFFSLLGAFATLGITSIPKNCDWITDENGQASLVKSQV